MIAGMRKFARSKWALVVVFIPLVVALAVFLPDNFSGGLSGGTLSKIGDREVKVQEVEFDLQRQLERIRVSEGQVISPAEAAQQGLVQRLIEQLNNRNTLLAYADKVGIKASDESVAPYLQRSNAFVDEFGALSLAAFDYEAQQRRMTTREFTNYIRDELTANYIAEAAGAALNVPDVLSQPWINYLGESRLLSLAQVTAATAPEPAEPTEAELQAWYDSHKQNFEQPERRRISVLTYSPDDFIDKVELTDEQLRAAYQERIKEYSTPETRVFVEFSSQNRSAVQNFVDLSMQGLTPEEAMAQTPGITRTEVTRKPADVENEEYRNFLFNQLAVGKVHNTPIRLEETDPWMAIMVASVVPGIPTPYEEVAAKVRRDVAFPEAANLFEASGEPFRDAAGGQSLEDVAKQFGIPLVQLAPIDAQARTALGDQAEIMTQNVDAMRQLFTLAAGDMTNVFEGDNVRTMFRLDEVIAPHALPFADVKVRVRNAFMTEKAIESRKAATDAMVAAVKAGATFEKAAADAKMLALPPVKTLRNTEQIDPAVVAAAFALKAGEVAVVSGRDGNPWVARVDQIEAVTPDIAAAIRAQIGGEVTQSLLQDMNEVFVLGLRSEVPYQRDDAAIATYLQQLVGDSAQQ